MGHKSITVFGIFFDLLVVPALLWKPARKLFFLLSIFFHLFNSLVFRIGIFPYLSLAFCVFFFEPNTIRKVFIRKASPKPKSPSKISLANTIFITVLSLYFLIQLILPIRHHFIEGDVLWTEEGHRLSWRMMLRSRAGNAQFKVVNKTTGKESYVKLNDYLSRKQLHRIGAYPDFIWQFAQRLNAEYAAKGEEIAVFAEVKPE